MSASCVAFSRPIAKRSRSFSLLLVFHSCQAVLAVVLSVPKGIDVIRWVVLRDYENEVRGLLLSGNAERALKILAAVVDRDRLDAQAWVFIGDAFERLGRRYEARLAYDRGSLLDPTASWAGDVERRLSDVASTRVEPWLRKALKVPRVTVSAVIVAKNEERSIARCIESLDGVVDEIVVVDTGSTDATRDVALERGAKVVDFEWCDDFAAARNFGLGQVTSDWVLWIDADEWLDARSRQRVKLVAGLFADIGKPVVLRIGQFNTMPGDKTEFNFDQARFHSEPKQFRWVGRIHEQLLLGGSRKSTGSEVVKLAIDVRIWHDGYNPEIIDKKAKLARNVKLLQACVGDDQEDIASWGFLGRELFLLGEVDEAIQALRTAEKLSREQTWYGRLPEVRMYLVAALISKDDFDEARKVAENGTRENPNFPGHWFDLGRLELKAMLDHHERARVAYMQALESAQHYRGIVSYDADITRWKAKAGLADLVKLSGNLGSARQLYRDLLEVEPELEAVKDQLQFIEEQRLTLNADV